MISLLTFIQTGRLGAIGLGSSRTEVELAFGPPDDWEARFHFSKSRLWKYGNIELHFDRDLVFLIFSDDFDIPNMGDLAFDSWEIRRNNTLEQVELWLRDKGIVYQAGWGNVALNNDEGSWWVVTENSQVTLRFDWIIGQNQEKCLTAFWCR